MNRKNILVIIMASALSISTFTSCEVKKRVSQNSSTNAVDITTEVNETVPTVTVPPLEDAVAAQSGDAYLAFSDSKYNVQYNGKNEGDGSMLAYDAGIAQAYPQCLFRHFPARHGLLCQRKRPRPKQARRSKDEV